MRPRPLRRASALLAATATAWALACTGSSSAPPHSAPLDGGLLDGEASNGEDAGPSFTYSGVVSATDDAGGDCIAAAIAPVDDSGFGSGSEISVACSVGVDPSLNLHVIVGLTAAYPPPVGSYGLAQTIADTNSFYLELTDGGLLTQASGASPATALTLTLTRAEGSLYSGALTATFDTAAGAEQMTARFAVP